MLDALAASEILAGAADLLAPPGAWTRGANARDAAGAIVDEAGEAACSWCLLGAVLRVAGGHGQAREVLRHIGVGDANMIDLTRWNDAPDRRQGEVVARLRIASQRLRRPAR